jgi:aerobic carbon-monoxide dehydrogenase large subunit
VNARPGGQGAGVGGGMGGGMGEGIGAAMLRREDHRLLRGQGRYVADISAEGMLHCAFVRSPHAHARLASIDTADALARPGVIAVLTGEDMAADGVGPMRSLWRIPGVGGTHCIEPPRYSLGLGLARHVGEAVALVVAATREQAQDAAEQIQVDWEPLPAVVDVGAAAAGGAPQVHPEASGNLSLQMQRGDAAAVEAAFAQARHRVQVALRNQRLICAAMEPRAVLALPGAPGGGDGQALTLYSSTQVPHQIRKFLAEQLGLAESSVRVIAPDVGGGFGTKGKHYPEETVLAWAARRLGRPLRWVAGRSESFVSDYHARDHLTRAELALDEGGRFLAVRVSTLANLGAYVSTVGAAIPSALYTAVLSGPYRIGAIFADVKLLFTHTVPTDAYRGAGRPEACYVLERLVEAAAAQTGIDRVELRRRNLIRREDMPYATPIGPVYDSGDFPRVYERLLELSDYAGFAGRRRLSEAAGLLRGFGLCYFIESSGVAPSKLAGALGARIGFFDSAEIRVAADGSLQLACGTHSHGQGHATSFAQVLSQKLGVPLARIEVIEGDTARVPFGTGTFGSRSMVVAGSAISLAADKIIAKARRIAAHLMEAAERDLEQALEDGQGGFRVIGTDRRLGWADLAAAALAAHNLPAGMEPGLNEAAFYDPSNFTWTNGAQACELEVDPQTGVVHLCRYAAVDDIGTVINPIIVEGQVHGAVAQGVGQALFEQAVYDPDSGQLYSASFMDYALPRADCLPMVESENDTSQPCTHNPLGAKGCGESGTVGAPPALMSALLDALRPLGVADLQMPFTPERIWRAIRHAGPPAQTQADRPA